MLFLYFNVEDKNSNLYMNSLEKEKVVLTFITYSTKKFNDN